MAPPEARAHAPLGAPEEPTEHTRLLLKAKAAAGGLPVAPAPRVPLGWAQKTAYALGGMGPSMFDRVRSLFTSPFLLEVAQVSPYSVGVLLLVTKFWDGINDPLIGYLSDRCESKWGRRRAFLLYGAVPLSVSFVALWWVPPMLNDDWLVVYYLVGLLIFEATSSIAKIPHNCMVAELAADYDDVTSLSQYRYFAAVAAGMAASMLQSIFLDWSDNEKEAYLLSSLPWALVSVLTLFACVWGTGKLENREPSPMQKKRMRAAQNQRKATSAMDAMRGFFSGAKDIFQYRAYLIVTTVYISTLALEFVQSNQVLYIKYVLGASTDVLTWVILIQTIARLIAIPVWTWISRHTGKKKALLAGLLSMAGVQAAYFLLGDGDIMLFYILTPIRGAVGVCPVLILFSMVADCVDLDDLTTGNRREGLFYSFFVFLQKVSISGALALSSFVIGLAGYEAPDRDADRDEDTQSDSVVMALRLMTSFVPAGIFLLAWVVALWYPITKDVHSEIKAKLEARDQAEYEAEVEAGERAAEASK